MKRPWDNLITTHLLINKESQKQSRMCEQKAILFVSRRCDNRQRDHNRISISDKQRRQRRAAEKPPSDNGQEIWLFVMDLET